MLLLKIVFFNFLAFSGNLLFGVEAKNNPATLTLASEISTEIDELWHNVEANMKTMMDAANNDEEVDIKDRIRFRYQVSTINDRCVAGALKLVKASGGATVYLGHEITNKFIDIMMTQVHVANISDPFALDFGSSFLGSETENLML